MQADFDVQIKATESIKKVKDNRRRYRNLSTLDTFKPTNLERDNVIEFKVMREERELKKLIK